MDSQNVNKAKKIKKKSYTAFKCDECSKQFSDKWGLQTHRATHSTEKPFACERCAYRGKTKKYLRRHVKIAHEERKFECSVCGKTFHFGCKLNDHMRVHTGEKPYKCGVCDKAFNSSYSLSTHKLIHTDSKPYQCPSCPYSCRDSSTLRKHRARHAGNMPAYQCGLCDMRCTSKARLRLHVAERHFAADMRRMECDKCGKRFRFRDQIIRHIRVVHEKSLRSKCDLCGLVLSNKSQLPYHMRTHVDQKPFVCSAQGCGKRYKHTSSLQKHVRSHDPARQYPCQVCDKLFTREIRMKAHLKTHMAKVKNVECDYCGVCFYNKQYLTTHIQRKHGRKGQQYICDLCRFVTTNKPSLVMHIKYGHGDNPLRCSICKKICKHEYNLKLHYWLAHEHGAPANKKRKKKKKKNEPPEHEEPVVEVKEEPCENLYDGDEYFEVEPKMELEDDEGLEELTKMALKADARAEPPQLPADIIEEFITPVRQPRTRRHLEDTQDMLVDKQSEKQMRMVVNGLLEKTRRKATRGRKYNTLARRAAGATATTADEKASNRENNENESNSLVTEDFSINQTIDNRDRIVDEATIADTEAKGLEHVEEHELDSTEGQTTCNTEEKGTGDVEKLGKENIEEQQKDSVEENGKDSGNEDTDKDTIEDEDTTEARDKTEMKSGKNRKLKFNTHQCYVCFKLYQTKEELLEHCKDHFDLCNTKTLKKCPLCDFATSLSLSTHLKRKHKIKIKYPYGNFTDNKHSEGSRYYYEVNDEKIKKVEIIPSIKNLNKRASNKIDKRNRERKNKAIVKNKLVKKGKEWIVTTEKMKINDYFVPKLDKLQSKNTKSGYLDRLKELYKVAKKEGRKMLFPCDSCDKICQTMAALKLHGRKHEADPKPFKPKVWKHKNKSPDDEASNDPKTNTKNVVTNKENRTAKPKPVVNKHKCDKELIDFYERNIKGSDVEFWQFLKIYNKMGRENINDFDDLQKSHSFGLHCNVQPEENTSNSKLSLENGSNADDSRKVTAKKVGRVKKTAKHAYTRVVRLSKRELMRRNEARARLREKIKHNSEKV